MYPPDWQHKLPWGADQQRWLGTDHLVQASTHWTQAYANAKHRAQSLDDVEVKEALAVARILRATRNALLQSKTGNILAERAREHLQAVAKLSADFLQEEFWSWHRVDEPGELNHQWFSPDGSTQAIELGDFVAEPRSTARTDLIDALIATIDADLREPLDPTAKPGFGVQAAILGSLDFFGMLAEWGIRLSDAGARQGALARMQATIRKVRETKEKPDAEVVLRAALGPSGLGLTKNQVTSLLSFRDKRVERSG